MAALDVLLIVLLSIAAVLFLALQSWLAATVVRRVVGVHRYQHHRAGCLTPGGAASTGPGRVLDFCRGYGCARVHRGGLPHRHIAIPRAFFH